MNIANETAGRTTLPGLMSHFAGYVGSVLAATIVSSMILAGLAGEIQLFFGAMMFAGFYISVTAIPGFILTLVIARKADLRHWFYFACAGALNGMLALGILALALGGAPMVADLTVAVLAGGFCGGLAYWCVVYKRR